MWESKMDDLFHEHLKNMEGGKPPSLNEKEKEKGRRKGVEV